MASIQSIGLKLLVKHYIARKLRAEVSIDEQRVALERLEKAVPSSPFTKISELQFPTCNGEWIKHRKADATKAILYLHGGGFTTGSPTTHRLLAERLSASSGAAVLLLDYRLAPETPFPGALDDCVSAYQWLLQQGITPENLAIAGDSAGGNLTLSTLLKLKEVYSPLPAAAVLFSPWLDLTLSGDTLEENQSTELMLSADWLRLMADHYAGGDKTNHLCSPLNGDLTDLPPILIQVDQSEILYSDSTRLAQKLEEAETPYELEVVKGLWHVWQTFVRFLPEANASADKAAEFIKNHWDASA